VYLLIRNDDGYPVVIGVYYDDDEVKAARDKRGPGYFIFKEEE
jgi:hypothetical protein